MSERPRENSVLFSLRELRRIEDDRVKKEQEAARAKAEAERQAKEAADRATRDAEERRIRDDADRARMAREEEDAARARGPPARAGGRAPRPRRGRDAHQRGAHAPRDAAQEEALAGQGGADRRRHLVLAAAGVGYKMYSQHQAELASERAERARVEAQARKDRAELEAKLVGIERNMNDQLAKAKTEEERQRIRIAAAEAKAAAQASRQGARHSTTKTEDKPVQLPKSKGKREISDNPLEGLDLK